MSEGAVKVAVHRLRRRYRKLLKEEIARTIVAPEALEDELGELLAALVRKNNLSRRVTFSTFWVRNW